MLFHNLDFYNNILGLFAGALTTFSFFPEVLKTFQNKKQAPNTFHTIIMMLIGNISWVIYAYLAKDYILCFYTSISFIFFAFLLYSKFIFK